MRILLTGATGYIGKRLLPALLAEGHDVICCVRDKKRLTPETNELKNLQVVEVNFLKKQSLRSIPPDIDGAYFLIHSRSFRSESIIELCDRASRNFMEYMEFIHVKHVIFLSDLAGDPGHSKFHSSIRNVEKILSHAEFNLTVLRAGNIIGSGSATFEIIRNLVEKSPIIIGPKWLSANCQPVAIRDVITYLTKAIFNPQAYDRTFEIGGPELMTFKEVLIRFARARKLQRKIISLPVKDTKLSAYGLFLISSASYGMIRILVENLVNMGEFRKNEFKDILKIHPLTYDQAINLAFQKIEQNYVLSSWKDAFNTGDLNPDLSQYVQVPRHGCYRFIKIVPVVDPDFVMNKIWSIGGEHGWYYANWLWQIRGFLDKLSGGVGLKRGRTNADSIHPGDALDFWRVIIADKLQKRMLLFAEMKLPGEGWLELRIDKNNNFHQIATFRPRGIWGRIYWYAVLPFHSFVFSGMVRSIKKSQT